MQRAVSVLYVNTAGWPKCYKVKKINLVGRHGAYKLTGKRFPQQLAALHVLDLLGAIDLNGAGIGSGPARKR